MTKTAEILIRLEERQIAQDEKLEIILAQVKETNGRVTALERWKDRMKGIWIAIIVLGGIVTTVSGVVFTILEFVK